MTDRNLNIRLSVSDDGKVIASLRQVGAEGDKSLKKLELSGVNVSASMRVMQSVTSDLRGNLEGVAGSTGIFGSALGKIGPGGTIAAVALAGLYAVVSNGVKSFEEAEQAGLKLEAMLRANGYAAGLTAEEIVSAGDKIEKSTMATSEQIQNAAGTLSTFQSVTGDTFLRALELSQDMAAALGMDVSAAAQKLGRALQDPIDGVDQLRKANVLLTNSQEEQIKSFVKTGNQIAAQNVILDALASRVGGAGSAEAGGLIGAGKRLGDAWDNMSEDFVRATGITTAYHNAIVNLTSVVEVLGRAFHENSLSEDLDEAEKRLQKLKDADAYAYFIRKEQAEVEKLRLQVSKEESEANKRRTEAAAAAKKEAEKAVSARTAAEAKKVLEDLEKQIDVVGNKKQAAIQQALSRLSPEASQSERDAVTKRAAALYDATEGATKLAEAMKQGEAVTKANLSATALYAEEIDKLEKLLKAGAISQDTFNAAMGKAWEDSLKKRTDAVAGMQRFNVEYQKQAQDTASAVERFFKNGFTQAESSLAGFLTKGKAGFDELNDFVKTFFNDLTTQWVRTKITAPLMNAITGSSAIEDIISSVFHEGGVVGQGGGQRSVSPLMFANAPRYHTGGVAGLKPGEVPAILEKGEIVIPKGKTLGGGGVNMKVEIINNAPGVTATPSMSADGSVLKVMINSQVNEAIMSGATDKAQRTRFGTPRTMKER